MHHKRGLHHTLLRLLLVLALSIVVGLSAFLSFSPAKAASSSWPVVGPGSSGENVYSVQLMLQAQGYSLSVDGIYGPQTTANVEAFQSAHGLSSDGVVDPQTWPMLIVPTSQGSSGPAVTALQRQLNAHGASLGVDGSFGPATTTAVRNYQSSHGLSVDGVAGLQTWSALVGVSGPQLYTWPILGQGSSGENVYSIQLMLQAQGYSLSADGSYGSQTASTVSSFQSAHGLSSDSVVGPQTWPMLIVPTSQGSSGPAVTALQRQLNAHGASLSVDGSFGPATTTAVRNYQSSHGLNVDGVAQLQTWSSIVGTAGSPSPPPPSPPPSGTILWGVDTVSFITPSFLSQIDSNLGTPAFVGRYLDALSFRPMNASEASYIHSQNIRILPILSDFGGDTTYSTGVSRANDAIAKAQALGIPAKTVIIADIENNSSVDAGFIQGWYTTVSGAGYSAGYYMNPYPGSSPFASAFCSAVSSNSAIGSSIMYTAQPSKGETPKSSAPPFSPASVTCGGYATGQTLIWQYGLQGSSSINVDTDELQSSVPLW